MAGRFDWDRVRRDSLVRDRGAERTGPAFGFPSRKPASADQQRAAIARWQGEFSRLPYGDQLAYLTTLRQRLTRLQASEDKAAATIAEQFKPLLKKPAKAAAQQTTREPPPTKTPTTTRAVRLSGEQQRATITDVVSRNPGELSRKRCLSVLLGEPMSDPMMRRDPKYGSCSDVPRAELKKWVDFLVLDKTLVARENGGLFVRAADPGRNGR